MRAFLVAGTHSGVGKTTLTLALISALRARGLRTRAFKVGPDFIDAAHLAAATGAPCLNLDGWMMDRRAARQRRDAAAAECDIAVVEGVMGLYDGRSGANEAGSSAEMAKWLELPVLLVADAAGAARSLAATVLGFQSFDPAVRLAGVIFNRVGSAGHAAYLREAMAGLPHMPIIGACPADGPLQIPERHLGLRMPAESAPPDHAALAAWTEEHLDVDAVLALAAEIAPAPAPEPRPAIRRGLRLGVARDAAFCFYYPDNLEALRAAGIELVEFSPLDDAALPSNLHGLYLGGGYPELHAARLSSNVAMRAQVRAFAAADGFIYAECGGMMYLARTLDGVPMAGVLPCAIAMQPKLAALGYREVAPVGLGADPALRARGHEFHYSRMTVEGVALPPAHWVLPPDSHADQAPRPEGFHCGSVVASYIHLHFGSCAELPARIAQILAQISAQRLRGQA